MICSALVEFFQNRTAKFTQACLIKFETLKAVFEKSPSKLLTKQLKINLKA